MTFVRPAPGFGLPTVATVTPGERAELERLVATDPIVNAVVVSRLTACRSLDPGRLGGVLLGARSDATLRAAAFNGANLLPIGGHAADWVALAEQVAQVPQVCTSIVGRADAVSTMWATLTEHWGRARAVRAQQPLLVLGRGDRCDVTPHPRLQLMHPHDLERYLPAAAAMFHEELGISPYAGRAGATYQRRVESLLASGRSFGVVGRDGRVEFKADLGAITDATCQVQGVWVRPDLRGRGLGTAALAGVLARALRLAPTASLYVNDFNSAALRMYAKLGLRQIATLQTVLF